MERVLARGAEFAEGANMLARGSERLGAAARSTGAGAPGRTFPRWPQRETLLPLVYYALVSTVLAAADYPISRIAVVAVAAALQQAHYYFAFNCAGRDPKRCLNADPDQLAWLVSRAQLSILVTTGVAAAATGGAGSPLLVTLLAAYFAAASVVGDRRQTRLLLGATALVASALAFLPASWAGPGLPRPVYGVLAALSVLGVGALLAPVHLIARSKGDELARWRKEMASDALTRAQSLEQIGSKLGHELKNPLTGVKALVQLGLRNPAEAASHERLEIVDREVTRMQEIVRNYLSFTRPLQQVTPRRIALGPIVADTLVVLSARADDARVRLFAQGDALAEADPHRLKEALLNLVANAIEATPAGGQVVVEVRAAGDRAEIVVRDTGRGMPPDTLSRVGTPFFTTRVDGTGLGVVLARSVIAQHGGALRYDSEPGKGTLVSFTLPRAMGEVDGARAAGG
jgi:two-component system, NtrC family, sensor histidine kinase HydH